MGKATDVHAMVPSPRLEPMALSWSTTKFAYLK